MVVAPRQENGSAMMSAIVSDRLPPAAPALRELSLEQLSHIPGTDGWPVVGSTFSLLADPKGAVERRAAQYGRVYRTLAFGVRTVALLGPEANEFVLFDSTRLFSSMQGWNWLLERLFPRGLMLLDFDEHRLHRKALSVAFKSGPMKSYLESLNRGIARGVGGWKNGSPDFLFYPAIKQLTLDLAAVSFLGAEIGSDFEQVKRAFVDMVAAAVSVVRRPIPGTQMARGVKGRAFMVDYFGCQIEARRASDGADIFTQLCKATTDDGALLSSQEIIDHMSFLMMAAHDTLTSSLTSFVWFLCSNPEWQERLRAEIRALGLARGEPLPYDRLDELPATEMAFKESLRIIPPCRRSRAESCAIRNSADISFPRARASPSIRSTRTTCRRFGRSRRNSIRCASPRKPPAAGTSSPSCLTAAGRTCASGCISPTYRRNASPITCSRRPPFPWPTIISLHGNSGRFRSPATACMCA
jgi:cytochrome P450